MNVKVFPTNGGGVNSMGNRVKVSAHRKSMTVVAEMSEIFPDM